MTREAVGHVEVESVHEFLRAVEIAAAEDVDGADDGALVAGRARGVVGGERIAVGLRDRQAHHGAVAEVTGRAAAKIDGADRGAAGERSLGGGVEREGVIGDAAARGDDVLAADLPVIGGDGEPLHKRHLDDHAGRFAVGGLGRELAVAGGDAATVAGAIGDEAGDRAAIGIGAAGDGADERAGEELREVGRVEALVVGAAHHRPAHRTPVDAILRLGRVAEIRVALVARGSRELERIDERETRLAAHQGDDSLGIERGDVAVAVRVGVGREAEEIVAREIEAGAGRVEAGEGRAKIVVGLETKLAAEGRADLVAAPEGEDIAARAEVAAAEPRDAVADEARAEGLLHALGVHVVAGGDERAVAHGKGAGEGIEGPRRIGLVDGRDEQALPGGPFLVFDYPRGGVEQRGFPRPRVEDFAARAGDAAINGGVHPVRARRDVGEALVGDRDGGGRAGQARRAVGVGRAGG